jgi:hypothetical protein
MDPNRKQASAKSISPLFTKTVYQAGLNEIRETDKFVPEINGPDTKSLIFNAVPAFRDWLIAGAGKYIISHISIHPPMDEEIRASDVVQLSIIINQVDPVYQPVILPVKTAEDVRQIVRVIEDHTPAADFLKMWTIRDNLHIWDQKTPAAVTFNSRGFHDSAKYRGWLNFLYEYEEASNDRNYVFAWTCDKVHLRLFIHQQRIDDLKVITVNFTPGNEPYIREYLQQKAIYVRQSLSLEG